MVMRFDYGRYSNQLNRDARQNYSAEQVTIDGRAAKVVTFTGAGSHQFTMGVYFADVGSATGQLGTTRLELTVNYDQAGDQVNARAMIDSIDFP